MHAKSAGLEIAMNTDLKAGGLSGALDGLDVEGFRHTADRVER
jgi:hypothetical protein